MINKNILATIFILTSTSTYTMKNNFRLIKKWEDLTPFAGKIVAYKATSCHIKSEDDYRLNRFILNYGYIDSHPDYYFYTETGYMLGKEYTGYNMDTLVIKNSFQCNTPLTNREIKHEPFYMREIGAQEAQNIINALVAKKAKFSWEGDEQKRIAYLLSIVQKKRRNRE